MDDGFLDNVVTESAWETDNDSYVILEGTTGTLYESVPFRCGFSFSYQNFTLDYVFDGEEVSDKTAGYISSTGGLTADLEFIDSESGETYKFDVDEYKDLQKLEELVDFVRYMRAIIPEIILLDLQASVV